MACAGCGGKIGSPRAVEPMTRPATADEIRSRMPARPARRVQRTQQFPRHRREQ